MVHRHFRFAGQQATKVYMKRFFLVTLIAITFANCKKEKNKNHDPLIGKWELRVLHGGLAASDTIHYSAGNGTTLTFSDTTYESYWMNQFVSKGTYSKTRALCYQTYREMDAIVINNGKTFYEFSADTLTLYSGVIAADGAIEKYVRFH